MADASSPVLVAETDAQYDDNDQQKKDNGERYVEPDVKSIHLHDQTYVHTYYVSN